MAYIAPDGVIEIFGDVSLSPGQEDTLYFASTSAKDTYFSGITKLITLSNQSYTRKERGYLRIEATMSQVYNACYMRFKNSSFENKWWYAFITSVDYINNITCEIQFELDTMMCWMGDFTLAQCFVERQHTETDAIGDNIVDENLEIGDYVYNAITRTNLFNTYDIIVGASVDANGDPVAGGTLVNNIYTGIVYHRFSSAQWADVNTFIDSLTDKAKSDAIVACVMCPSSFSTSSIPLTDIVVPKNLTTLDGYTPKNRKLYTFPYNFLQATNGQGNYATFRYEFWRTNLVSCEFQVGGVLSLQPCAVLTPKNYKNSDPNVFNYSEKLELNNFPQCAFNTDQYKAYLAQNASTIMADAFTIGATGLVQTIAQAGAGNDVGVAYAGINAITSAVRFLAKHHDYSRKPPQSHGATTTEFEASRREKDFWFYSMSITRNYAKLIDDFFTMFGYAVNEVKIPNMNARPYFTYVKTTDCIVHGNIPADDCRKIEERFNNGVRFWKDHTAIGGYLVNNSVP